MATSYSKIKTPYRPKLEATRQSVIDAAKQQQVIDEVTNFIEYYTSDDELRMKMQQALQDYMKEVYNQ